MVAVEAREREVRQESPRDSEGGLRHRFDIGEESLGHASEKEVPEDGEDARTLPVEVDTTGHHYRSWRSAVNCSLTFCCDVRRTSCNMAAIIDSGSNSGSTRRGCATMIEPSMS